MVCERMVEAIMALLVKTRTRVKTVATTTTITTQTKSTAVMATSSIHTIPEITNN